MPNLRRLSILCTILAAAWLIGGSAAQAGGPTYLMLRPAPHGHYPGTPHMLQPQPYSYGYFGAQPSRRFRTKHYNYYGNTLTWSYR